MKAILFILLFALSFVSKGQQADSLSKVYTAAQRNASNRFSAAWYPNRAKIYSLNEKQFLQKIDSLKIPFEEALNGQAPTFIIGEKRDIGYFFDRLILDYPYFHYTHTGKNVTLSRSVLKRLTGHIADFNPEWAFYTCVDYAKKGWVAVSVEYRLADRHETTPFEAVKDARSAIRWLRMNADAYHIDTGRIVVSGNSAGGHLALTTALADKCNEATNDLRYSASPNLILVNAGVYDLYAQDNTDWISTKLKDKTKAGLISPAQLVKKITSPILIVHGTQDRSVDYVTAKAFAQKMEAAGNTIVFQTLEGAPHYIWFDRRFSGKVTTIRNAFLAKYDYNK